MTNYAENKRPIGTIKMGGTTWRDVTMTTEVYEAGGVALQLYTTDDLYEELLCTATVYLEGQPPADGCVWIKNYSENEGLDQELVRLGIVELTGRTARTGWVEVPEARLL